MVELWHVYAMLGFLLCALEIRARRRVPNTVLQLSALMPKPALAYWRRDLRDIDAQLRLMFDTYIIRHFGDGGLSWLPCVPNDPRQLRVLADEWRDLLAQPDLADGGRTIIKNHVARIALCARLWHGAKW